MWGLSTYRRENPIGMAFVVDNSISNRTGETDFYQAIVDAMAVADERGTDCFYFFE
jgi:hypothetical protein